jgi:hypothetical protein
MTVVLASIPERQTQLPNGFFRGAHGIGFVATEIVRRRPHIFHGIFQLVDRPGDTRMHLSFILRIEGDASNTQHHANYESSYKLHFEFSYKLEFSPERSQTPRELYQLHLPTCRSWLTDENP